MNAIIRGVRAVSRLSPNRRFVQVATTLAAEITNERNGDVVLNGPLVGSGLLVATGNVTLNGGAKLDADVLAAVISGGDLTVAGKPDPKTGNPQGSSFNGLLYSKGDLTLSNTRTIGTVLSASDASGVPGKLVVEDSVVISTPDTSDFRLVVKGFKPEGGGGLGGLTQEDKTIGNGWEILEPNPADLLVEGTNGIQTFVWADSHLKIRVKQGDGSWRVFDNPTEAQKAGIGLAMGDVESLTKGYYDSETLWKGRVKKLNEEKMKELVEIFDFDLNEFLRVSGRLKAKRVFYVN
jgi:hypothetical protein